MATFGENLAYALLPAAAGYAAGLLLMLPALRPMFADPQTRGFGLVLAVLPSTPVLFAFVSAFLASQDVARDLTDRLLVVGGVAALTCVAQGLTTRRGAAGTGFHKDQFGRLLVQVSLWDIAVLAAFAWFFLGLEQG